MNRILISTALGIAAVSPMAVHGQESADTRNRFSLGARIGFNFKADFHNGGGSSSPANPGPETGAANHTYDDGYVLLDSSGDAGGLTWNWGYQNESQVVGDTMQFHATQTSAHSSSPSDPQYGLELIYQRVLGDLPEISSCWGLEVGFGFTDLDLRGSGRGNVSVLTDSYELNGVLPPGAGYQGTFEGPGALLGDIPTRTLDTATLRSDQKLSGQMFTIRLGPFFEWNITRKLSLAASVGLTLAPTMLDYDFSESVTLSGGSTYVSSGHSSKTELLYGPYVSGTLRFAFSKHWSAYVGAQFQSLNDLDMSVGSRTARLDAGATVYVTAGLNWSF